MNDAQKGAILSQIYRLDSEPISFLPQKRAQTVTVSPGELRKLVIALALQAGASFLILDEPTNHLDRESVLLLETALSDSECALLLCSHDKSFIQALTTEIWCAERTGHTTEGLFSVDTEFFYMLLYRTQYGIIFTEQWLQWCKVRF